MKKIALLAVFMLCGIVGCSQQKAEPNNVDTTEANQETIVPDHEKQIDEKEATSAKLKDRQARLSELKKGHLERMAQFKLVREQYERDIAAASTEEEREKLRKELLGYAKDEMEKMKEESAEFDRIMAETEE